MINKRKLPDIQYMYAVPRNIHIHPKTIGISEKEGSILKVKTETKGK